MRAVRLVILPVNAACVLVLGDWAVEDVVAGPLLDTAEVQAMVEAMVEGVTILVIVPQSAAVSHLQVVATIASHHHRIMGVKSLHMPMGKLWDTLGAAGLSILLSPQIRDPRW